MSVLKRYTKSVDGTIPVQALLYEDEDLLASQDAVGIYNGSQKSPPHQAGTVYATTHRLFYVDAAHPDIRSFWLDLSHVTRTEHYAGLLRSSAKVTLYLSGSVSRQAQSGNESSGQETQETEDESWECAVCSYRNPPGLSPSAAKVCALCGVPRTSVPSTAPSSTSTKSRSTLPQLSTQHLSSSLPSSSLNLHSLSAGSSPVHTSLQEIPCPACTFLNHPSLRECEICGTALPRPQNTSRSAPASRPTSDDEDDEDDLDDEDSPRMIRVSFRKGGDKPFYAVLRRSLLGKAWEATNMGRTAGSTATRPSAPSSTATRSGINGILQTVESTASTAENNMLGALQDLEALMVKAREMVRLAEDLNERLSAANANANPRGTDVAGGGGAVEPEEATFIRSSLAQLGLQISNAPVTLDMMRDERKWTEELARELAGVLQGQGQGGKAENGALMRRRGVVGLDEVWGGWNRARGVALIPPATFLLVLPHLPAHTSPPIHKRTFSSGLSVLHTPPYSKAAFAARLVGLIKLAGPKTTVEIAQEEQIPIGLAQDMIFEVETDGEICRDDGGEGVGVFSSRAQTRWWVNVFKDYTWDGQVDFD